MIIKHYIIIVTFIIEKIDIKIKYVQQRISKSYKITV